MNCRLLFGGWCGTIRHRVVIRFRRQIHYRDFAMGLFLDPRRGDFEDDASSPERRSLISLAGSLLVEISLPKLLFTWLVMLVLPSLLLGLAPIAATAWINSIRDKINYTLTDFWPALVLVAIVAIGLLGGRTLYRLARDSFWSLISLGVEPMYLSVRETLRFVSERLSSARADSRRYLALRSRASAAAGVLICGLALLVLWFAWPSSRWWGTAADWAAPLKLAPVAVANSLVLVCGYLAIAALVWGFADAAMAQPQAIAEFPAASGARAFRVAHLSDVHVVGEQYGFRIESGRSGPRGNERFKQVLSRLAEIDAAEPLDAILITGDMTDAGRSAEWAELLDALRPYPRLVERVFMLPGNHDLNVADRANPARFESPASPNQRLRQLRVLSALCAVQGERVRLVDHEQRRLGPTLAEAIAPHLAEMTRFADTARPRVSVTLEDFWCGVFPMVVPPASDDGLGMLLLNSNADSRFSFTNALGTISPRQIWGIEIAAAAFPRASWLVALHHHLVEYPRGGHALAERIGTALINGNSFLRRLRPLAERVIFLHGHRHIDWIGRCAGMTIVSAPSPVMGVTDEQPTYFYLHTLETSASGVRLLAPRKVEVGARPKIG